MDCSPIKILRARSRSKLSCMLNGTKVLPSPEGLPRDYRGLAHLIGIKTLTYGFAGTDPISKILICWEQEEHATISRLKEYLETIDRYDVLDDIYNLIEEDVAAHQAVSTLPNIELPLRDNYLDKILLTVDDSNRVSVGLNLQMYDALVLFVDSDAEFATQLILTMEKEYGLKLCALDRDLLGGISFKHEAVMKLISERCNRIIVIVSNEFIQSEMHSFFTLYAQAIGIESGRRKVIPCIYKKCDLPIELRTYFILDYSRANSLWNFWEKLKSSLDSTSSIAQAALPSITFSSPNQFLEDYKDDRDQHVTVSDKNLLNKYDEELVKYRTDVIPPNYIKCCEKGNNSVLSAIRLKATSLKNVFKKSKGKRNTSIGIL